MPETKPTTPKAEVVPAKNVRVISTKTIDFPSLDWGIHAGETRELPVEQAAQEIILRNKNITIAN